MLANRARSAFGRDLRQRETVLLAAAGGLFGLSSLGFAKLADDVSENDPIVRWDSTIATWLHRHATDVSTDLLRVVTQLGSTHALLITTLAAILWLASRRRFADTLLLVVALVGSEALNALLKASFGRPRPEFADPLSTASGFSFPSGHAMLSITVYGALAFVVASRLSSLRARVWVALAALVVILSVGASRVYLGVHYASDVLAGYAAGLAWLIVCVVTVSLASGRLALPLARR